MKRIATLPVPVTICLMLGVAASAAPAATASTLVAEDPPGTVIAEDPTLPTPEPATARIVGVDANVVAGLSVTGHGGSTVAATAKGRATRSVTVTADKPAVLRRLAPGVTYTITIAGTRIGTAVPVSQVGPASQLRVETTGTADTVRLTWRHTSTRAEGGTSVRYDVVATPTGTPAGVHVRTTPSLAPVTAVSATTTITLPGLDPDQLYTFAVTPRNSASTGRSTRAVMSHSLSQITGAAVATIPGPVPTAVAATPAPVPAPASAPAPPATKTIYVCPDGYAETSGGLCQKSLPYTFDVLAYTTHQEATGPAPLLDSYETTGSGCPSGYSLEDYTWVKYCRRYGPAPTKTVKDATPSGYTDTGTDWRRKQPAPTGYSDDGAQWVKTVLKVARVVPA
jgi:hypothetical protein